jgi:hypothetical protein
MFARGLSYKYNAEIVLVGSKTCSKFSSWFNYLCIEIHGLREELYILYN